MLRVLSERMKAGVEIKVIGRVGREALVWKSGILSRLLAHAHIIATVIRPLSKQSLRQAELDSRREVASLSMNRN